MSNPQPVERSDFPATVPCLDEISALFRSLHQSGVRYCHWKSNEHLRASLVGDTDFDVLVSRDDAQLLSRILGATRFKRCLTAAPRRYPGIESYLGHDERTGRLVHFHVHYQLTLGERHLKGYRIPWEHLLLSRRLFRQEEGLYVADPALELILLTVRAALKQRARDLILAGLGRARIPAGVLREFRWLAEQVDRREMVGPAADLVGPRAAALLLEMVEAGSPSPRELTTFRKALVPAPGEYRSYHPLEAPWRRWIRELQLVRAPRLRPPQGGLLIVLLGADGSGKSTLTRELTGWLSRNLDVAAVYFGSGQGPVSLPRQLLQRAAALFKRARPAASASRAAKRRGDGASALRTAGELLWIGSLSRERRRRANRARRARNQGAIVVCDRFPQSQATGNDGPWLGHWLDHPSWARRTVARQELAAIQYVERLRPDLVIKLEVTRDIAMQRKPETPLNLLEARMRVLEQLRFGEETRVVRIDATRPLDEVLVEAKRAIWDAL
jgi:thymidylate kinase